MSIDIESLLKRKVLLLDGAMGTMLQQRGMGPGQCPELFGVENPETLVSIHRQYVEAGSDIIQTNTFGANRYKLAEYNLGDRVQEINAELVQIAKRAAKGKTMVAVSIGPTGKLLRPMGEATFDELYEVYSEQVMACEKAGADLISIETMTDVGEIRAALIAAKQNTKLPVIAHMSFETDGRTMMGTDPITAMIILEALQPLAIGANCSGGAKELLPVIKQLAQYSSLYLSVEPNAGLPRLINNETVFPDSPDEMAEYAIRLKDAGANIIGGCCGSTPQHIQAMASVLRGLTPRKTTSRHHFAFASRSQHVFIGEDQPLAMIGERINPTARRKLAQDIKDGKMQVVADEARKQVEAGAPILDVNMGVPGIDEAKAMKQAVEVIQGAVDCPLSIDTTDAGALEEGLKTFIGRPLINSTTGEDAHLEVVLPLAKKYGAAVLGLCLDESGIPDEAEGRLRIAGKIYEKAKGYGLRDEDIYIDCLVKTASAEQGQVMETIKALRKVKENFQVGTVLGISNVSHGLPARDILTSAYLTMAWEAGLDLPIMNPFDDRMMDANRAVAVLLNRDKNCSAYIDQYKDYKAKKGLRHPVCEICNIPDLLAGKEMKVVSAPSPASEKLQENQGIVDEIRGTVYAGDKEKIEQLLHKALQEEKMDPLEVVNKGLIPGIEKAGEAYDKKQYFLPQLMRAAETMKRAFVIVKPLLSEDSGQETGVIVMATVEGDIHDIGKNIVVVLLENYGFRVVDLGKDVPAETIVDTARKEKADIIGLSALMTTTMPRMQDVVDRVKEQGLSCYVMVGGAVLNQEYADKIGADAYSEDARAAVLTAKRLMEHFYR